MSNLKTRTRLAGSTVHNARMENDFYPTPTWATEALLSAEKFEGTTWEPACGDGAISKVLSAYGYPVHSSDLIDRGFGEKMDFLQGSGGVSYDNIVTNPPFSLCTEFINEAKKVSRRKIAMFLKTTALEGEKRHRMWIDPEFPFSKMYQFVKRVSFGAEAGTHTKGGMLAFAWFVWDKQHTGPATIHWISENNGVFDLL